MSRYLVQVRISKYFHFVSYLKNVRKNLLTKQILTGTYHRSYYILKNACCKKLLSYSKIFVRCHVDPTSENHVLKKPKRIRVKP